jgi:virulence-associated protein VagC
MLDAVSVDIDIGVDAGDTACAILPVLVVGLGAMEVIIQKRGQADVIAPAGELTQELVIVRDEVEKANLRMMDELGYATTPEMRLDFGAPPVQKADQVTEE